MNAKDYDFVGEPTIEKNGDDNPIVSYWVTYRKGCSETDKDQIMTPEEMYKIEQNLYGEN